MKKIKLTQEAYACGGEYRISASIMVLRNWYQASATDADGNEYTVIWDVANPDAEDESDMCDWSSPAAIIDAGGKEVSNLVELERRGK